jgi:hypothetical protein
MESKILKSTSYHLKLNDKEASWLRGICQNPFDYTINDNHQAESEEDSEMRKVFFNALSPQRQPPPKPPAKRILNENIN